MARARKAITPSEAYNMTFQRRLRELLDREGETQQKLAEAVGVSRQAIGQWKDGNTLPDVNSLTKIADYFKVTSDSLLYEDRSESLNIDVQRIHEVTGLSDNAIDAITFIKENFPENMPTVNTMLTGMNFINLIVSIKKFAIKDNARLWFVETTDGSQYSEAIDDKEAEAFKLFRLNDTFKSYMDDVIKEVKEGTENGKHSGTQK